jgi:TonB-linked SusC/RagA family outer membrane protein
MNKKSIKGCKNINLHLNKLFISLFSTVIFLIIGTISVSAANLPVKGTVTDEKNGALIGVSILVEGTSNATITDFNGNFSIVVPSSNSVLVISYVGYNTQKVKVNGQTNLNIVLTEETRNLDEVIVVGYGVQKKSLVTGSIVSVNAEDIGKTNISRAEEALQGKASGVQVVPVSGAPGAGMDIHIRGVSSNAGSNPLYIVDGIKTGDINYLDPSDIASMDVLKDAASCAIYGAEGGNGVIIITTKKGVVGKTLISYDFQHAFTSVANLPKLMNTSQYVQFMTEKNTDGNSILTAPVDQNYNTDWLGALFANGYTTKHHIAFSGGNEKSTYIIGLNYLKTDGIIVGDKDIFERFSTMFNSDHQIKKWLKVGHNLDYSHFTTKGINENGGEFGGTIGSALQLDPTTPTEYKDANKIPTFIQSEIANNKNLILKAPDGNYYGISQYVAGEITNPFVSLANTNGVTTNDKLLGNLYIDLTPFEGFKFTSRIGLELALTNNHYWNQPYYYDATNKNTSGITHDNNDVYYKWTWENFATYTRKFGDHNLSVLVGMSAEDYTHKTINGTGSPMENPTDNYAQLEFSSHKSDVVSGYTREMKKESYFGRLSYDYKGKYLFGASLREDGAGLSQVPATGRWGTFPSVSAGWVISNEDFFNRDVITNAKIRGSWGQNGSLNSLDDSHLFLYNSVITGISGGQPITYTLSDGTVVNAYEPNVLSNDKLKWETSEQLDLGIDLRAFNDRLAFTADYFVKTTKDMIFQGIPSYSSGNTAPQANGGDIKNTGFEFDLGFRDKISDFHYSINLNISPITNEVTLLEPVFGKRVTGASVGTGWPNVTMFEPGYSVWHFYGYKTHGIDPATGNPIFVTADGKDAKASEVSDKDKQDLGSAIPKFTYGGSIQLNYKNFDFGLTLNGAQGNKVALGWIRTDKLASNRPVYFYDGRWTTPGVAATKPGANPDPKTYMSDQYIFDGSYLRIQTIQLGYSIPESVLKVAFIQSVRLYVSLDNFFTFTSYPGMDPQPTIANNTPNNVGVDRGTYPRAKDIMLGASINF